MSPEIILVGSMSPTSQQAMDVACTAGLVCGGWCRSTEIIPGLVPGRYPLFDAGTDDYKTVLTRNIECSDGVLIISNNPDGKFTRQQTRLCDELDRPYLVVPYDSSEETVNGIRDWIKADEVDVLFVAGSNTEEAKDLTAVHHLFSSVFVPRAAIS